MCLVILGAFDQLSAWPVQRRRRGLDAHEVPLGVAEVNRGARARRGEHTPQRRCGAAEDARAWAAAEAAFEATAVRR